MHLAEKKMFMCLFKKLWQSLSKINFLNKEYMNFARVHVYVCFTPKFQTGAGCRD